MAVYGASETLKVLEEQSRPCQALAVEVIAACPPARDWSLPSNHATIAGALAAAVVALWPRGAVAAVPLALLVAASRVALGVHYPHDALTGLALGGAGVALVAWTAPARLRKVRAPAAA